MALIDLGLVDKVAKDAKDKNRKNVQLPVETVQALSWELRRWRLIRAITDMLDHGAGHMAIVTASDPFKLVEELETTRQEISQQIANPS